MTAVGPPPDLAVLRQMAALQARVCYMNVDRTLATWTRTSLSLIVFGVVADRFGILASRDHLLHVGTLLAPNPVSSVAGIALVGVGVAIVGAALVRHQAYRARWRQHYGHDVGFGPWSASGFALATLGAGLLVLVILLLNVVA